MLTITVDDSAFRATMLRLQEGMADLTPVMERIGYTLETNTRGRFETRTDPNGQRWKPWADSTRETYPTPGSVFAKTEGPGNGKLLDRYGTMLNGLSYEAESKSVRVGFAMPYAAYHEFGTKKMPRRGMLMGNPEAGPRVARTAHARPLPPKHCDPAVLQWPGSGGPRIGHLDHRLRHEDNGSRGLAAIGAV